MTRRTAVLALALLASPLAPAFAHEGHDHKLLGTVSEVAADRIVVRATKDGALSTVALDAHDEDHAREDPAARHRPQGRRPRGGQHRQRQGAAVGEGHPARRRAADDGR